MVTFYLFLDSPRSPQFFYSVLFPALSDGENNDIGYIVVGFATARTHGLRLCYGQQLQFVARVLFNSGFNS